MQRQQIIQNTDIVWQTGIMLHKRFQEEVWRGRPSFHNPLHVLASWEAAAGIFRALPDRDPLGLMDELERWNRLYRQRLSIEELEMVFKAAIGWHDTGNILKVSNRDDLTNEVGIDHRPEQLVDVLVDLHFTFLPHYTAKGAEGRSVAALKKLFSVVGIADPVLYEAIYSLILETYYQLNEDFPFALVMRVIDQLGHNLFRNQEEIMIGLLEENMAEDEKATLVPDREMNFFYYRSRELLPNDEVRSELISIWGKSDVAYKEGFSSEPVLAGEWLARLKEELVVDMREPK
jgi:hypothetical protein